MKRLFLLPFRVLVVAIAISGCASYGVTRFDPETGNPVEKTHLRAPWLTKTIIAGLATEVQDNRGTNHYSRKIGLESATHSTDSEALGILGQALMRGLTTGARAAVPIPVP